MYIRILLTKAYAVTLRFHSHLEPLHSPFTLFTLVSYFRQEDVTNRNQPEETRVGH